MILIQRVVKNGGGLFISETHIAKDRNEAYALWDKLILEKLPNASHQEINYCWADKCFVLAGDSNYTWTEV